MKQLLLILFFFPLLIYSQESLLFYDIKQINSKQMFLKVVLENGFEKNVEKTKDSELVYVYNLTEKDDGIEGSTFAYYYPLAETFSFYFYEGNSESSRVFEGIINKIQSECVFKEVDEKSDIIYYSCSGSKYNGWIGYYEQKEWKIIKTKL